MTLLQIIHSKIVEQQQLGSTPAGANRIVRQVNMMDNYTLLEYISDAIESGEITIPMQKE